jgi:hypothetical protein
MMCQICFENFDNFDNLITLNKIKKNCGHSFCQSCLITYLNYTNAQSNIKCPTCSINHPIIKWHETQMCNTIIWLINISIALLILVVIWNFKLMTDMIDNREKQSLFVFGMYNSVKISSILRQINSKLCAAELSQNIIKNLLYIAIIVLGYLIWNINESYNLSNLTITSEVVPLIVFEVFKYEIKFYKPSCIYYKIGNTTISTY